MPNPGTKLAPQKFRGDFCTVTDFIQHYKRLCIQCDVTSDAEKCETVLHYCSRREKDTISNMPSYVAQHWPQLRADILRLYDADGDTRQYRVSDVRNFVRRHKTRSIYTLAAWRRYCRAFIRLAGSLQRVGKIGDSNYATYF
jgi:hypothetical protein